MIGALVLAAGSSRRFGGDKRQARLPNGKLVIEQTLEKVTAVFPDVMVVLRHDDDELQTTLSRLNPDVQYFQAPDSALGMGHSLANAAAEIEGWDGAFIFLADMPFVAVETLAALKDEFARLGREIPRQARDEGIAVDAGSDPSASLGMRNVPPSSRPSEASGETSLPGSDPSASLGMRSVPPSSRPSEASGETSLPGSDPSASLGMRSVPPSSRPSEASGENSLPGSDSSASLRTRMNNVIIVPTHTNKPGHPVGFSHHYFKALSQLSGDKGAKAVINKHKAETVQWPTDDPGILKDIDSKEDLTPK